MGWVNYLVGVAYAFRTRGVEPRGGRSGSRQHSQRGGLSSSASLELAMAVAFDALVGAGSTAAELALIGQSAENDFIGVACGIMDQLSIAGGVAGHALRIDCQTLTITPVQFPAEIAWWLRIPINAANCQTAPITNAGPRAKPRRETGHAPGRHPSDEVETAVRDLP